jgi:hypothetical protein
MDGIFGMLAVAGGFGLAYGLTVLGLNALIAVMPRKGAGPRAGAPGAASTTATVPG